MAPAEESDQYLFNDLILTYNYLLDLCDDLSLLPSDLLHLGQVFIDT